MRLRLRVTPKSRADEIVGMRADGALQIRVSAAPEDGKANDSVLRLLSETLGLPKGAVRLLGGKASRDKWVDLDGIDAAELKRRLGREST
ncbi:MAG TPA: DUF167 domain-containing protein [Candidatus Limnocylindrales bacterium]|nr:DUF167 domain-containing protein [Candidatus Limnocylindrales bacterium]